MEHKKMNNGMLALAVLAVLAITMLPAWALQKLFLGDNKLYTPSGNYLYVNPSGQWQFVGSYNGGYVKVGAANYGSSGTPITKAQFNGIAGINSSAAVRAMYMPDATTVGGQELRIQDEGGAAATHSITVYPHGSQAINGASTYVISTNYGGARVYSDGANLFAK